MKSGWSNAAAKARDAAAKTVAHAGTAGQTVVAHAGAAGQTVKDAAATVAGLVGDIEGPSIPQQGPWSVGVGQILRRHPQLPPKLGGVVGGLDRLGFLAISAEAITFDRETVNWDSIEEIRFGLAADVLTSQALQTEVRRLTSLLPPVPGRAWLVRRIIELLGAFCLAAASRAGDDDEPDHQDTLGVPVGIVYRRRLRRGELTPGVFVALAAASVPTIVPAITAMASEHGITVTMAPRSRSRRQAEAIRRVAGALAERLARSQDTPEIESADSHDLVEFTLEASETDPPETHPRGT